EKLGIEPDGHHGAGCHVLHCNTARLARQLLRSAGGDDLIHGMTSAMACAAQALAARRARGYSVINSPGALDVADDLGPAGAVASTVSATSTLSASSPR